MKIVSSSLRIFGATALVLAAAVTTNAQNLVTNPGFETGNFSGYTLNEPGGGFSNVGNDPLFANSGNSYANLAPAIGGVGSLSQMIATTPGSMYTLSFFLANDTSLPVNFFQAFFNNVLVFSTTSPPFPSNGMYSQITIANLQATGNMTQLEFRYRHDDDFWRLDDVSVTAGTGVPETGATLWLALPAFAGLCLLHLRTVRRRRVRS